MSWVPEPYQLVELVFCFILVGFSLNSALEISREKFHRRKPKNVDDVLSILGLGNVDEMSAAAGGAVAGYAAPLGSGSDRPKKKRKNEYIDISLIDEVIELIMKRGITQ